MEKSLGNTEWMQQGNCKGFPPEVMIPENKSGVDRARKICADCVVKDVCLEYALVNNIEHGVWGGTSERQRREIKRRRKANA
jgi:WhiB family transcriptional regulator, redox-sensing transcriptional regulator